MSKGTNGIFWKINVPCIDFIFKMDQNASSALEDYFVFIWTGYMQKVTRYYKAYTKH